MIGRPELVEPPSEPRLMATLEVGPWNPASVSSGCASVRARSPVAVSWREHAGPVSSDRARSVRRPRRSRGAMRTMTRQDRRRRRAFPTPRRGESRPGRFQHGAHTAFGSPPSGSDDDDMVLASTISNAGGACREPRPGQIGPTAPGNDRGDRRLRLRRSPQRGRGTGTRTEQPTGGPVSRTARGTSGWRQSRASRRRRWGPARALSSSGVRRSNNRVPRPARFSTRATKRLRVLWRLLPLPCAKTTTPTAFFGRSRSSNDRVAEVEFDRAVRCVLFDCDRTGRLRGERDPMPPVAAAPRPPRPTPV